MKCFACDTEPSEKTGTCECGGTSASPCSVFRCVAGCDKPAHNRCQITVNGTPRMGGENLYMCPFNHWRTARWELATPNADLSGGIPFAPNSCSAPITNRMAHEEAAGMNLDDLFFRRSNIDPDAIYEPNSLLDRSSLPNTEKGGK